MGDICKGICDMGGSYGQPYTGGSGLSEWLFSEYYGDIVPTAGMALMLAIMWRIISYYLYLGIGVAIVRDG